MILKPNKWHEFQHYKHRSPPWIKLQKSLLDNYEFHGMQDASKALAMCLWLVASEHMEGEIDASPEKLAFRFRTTSEKIEKALKPLIENGFFIVMHGASELLAECLHDADSEKRREEKRREDIKPSKKTLIDVDFAITEELRVWAISKGINNLNDHLEPFISTCKAKGYAYVDWNAAFQNAVRNDWAKIGHGTKHKSKFVPA